MDLGIVNDASLSPDSGNFRAIHRPEIPNFGSAQVNQIESGIGLDQPIWNRSNGRAVERGGARAGKPRWVRISAITGGPSMAVMIVKMPPQCGRVRR